LRYRYIEVLRPTFGGDAVMEKKIGNYVKIGHKRRRYCFCQETSNNLRKC
jgi:hypothetical protein